MCFCRNNELGPLATASEINAHLYIGVTGTTGSGALGLAPMSSVCNTGRSRRINMNQYAAGSVKTGDAYTAEVRSNAILTKRLTEM